MQNLQRLQSSSRLANQRGDTIVILASMAVGLALATGLVADLGRVYFLRTRMQVATDAAALAGAQAIPDGQGAAVGEAQALARANGFALAAQDVSFEPGKRCHVQLSAEQPLFLGKLLDVADLNVGAASTAQLTLSGSGGGPRPFGVPDTDFVLGHCVNPGREYTFKTSADVVLHDQFQPLALDGQGYDAYVDAILHGARRTIHVGDVVAAQSGDMAGPTVEAIDQLVSDDETPYDEAVAHPDLTPRVISVPLIASQMTELDGEKVARVTGIGHFYITYAESGRVYGRFIGTATDLEIPGSQSSESVKLVQ